MHIEFLERRTMLMGAVYDPTLGDAGPLNYHFNIYDNRRIGAFLLLPGGDIVVAGGTTDTCDVIVRRYHSDGSPDLSFGKTGTVRKHLRNAFVDDIEDV